MSNERITLLHGRWQDRLANVERVDSMITDPSYSEKTVSGRRTGSEVRQSSIKYAPLTLPDVQEFVACWAHRVKGWWVVFGDEYTRAWWRDELKSAGLYVFGFVPWVKTDAVPRTSGDGPQMSAEVITIARTKGWPKRRGSRTGWYLTRSASKRGNGGAKRYPGAKPLSLMQQLLGDYSEPGDLVCDPFAGTGTTLLAAAVTGRRAIGAESDKDAYQLARRTILGSTVVRKLGNTIA